MRLLGCNASFNVQLQQRLQDNSSEASRVNLITKLVSLSDMLFGCNKKTCYRTHFKCKWLLTEGELSDCLVDIEFVDSAMKIILHSKGSAQCRFIIANLKQWRNELWEISECIELDYAHV